MDMIYTKHILDNGLTVLLKEIHTAPVISHWIWYRVGSRNELPGKTGISHWVEHMQYKGTRKYSSETLDRLVSRQGGHMNGFTYLDWTAFFETMPADKIGIAIDLEADRPSPNRFDFEALHWERQERREAYSRSFEAALLRNPIDGSIVRLFGYGYHINGLVINLLCTRGGFRSMGLDSATLAPAFALVAIIYAVCFAIGYACFHWKKMDVVCGKICRPAVMATLGGIWAVAFGYSLLCTGHADFFADTEILAQQDALPYIVTVRMRKFLRRLGFKEPDRKKIPAFADANSEKASLKYPRQDIVRNPNRKKYNIIWLVAESLRADFLKEDIMPRTWKYAQTAARFDNHYSGGHGTRPAMFSMFYGLYGLNWDVFMNQRRGPVFIDWLLEDDYQFLCQKCVSLVKNTMLPSVKLYSIPYLFSL